MGTVFKKLIERHESFRTSIEMIGDEPFQRIHEKVDFKSTLIVSNSSFILSIRLSGTEIPK